jgi:hypothetical protein
MEGLDRFITIMKAAAAVQPNTAASVVFGVITDVDDPDKLCRCKVLLQTFTNASGSVGYSTAWSEVLGLKLGSGKLPKNLLKQPVLAFPVMGSYEYVTVMLPGRLIYEASDELPIPSFENLGLSLISLGNLESFEQTVQLRNGKYTWEQTSPLKHLHRSGDRMPQQRDVSGDYQFDIEPQATDDNICITTVTSYSTNSKNYPPSF